LTKKIDIFSVITNSKNMMEESLYEDSTDPESLLPLEGEGLTDFDAIPDDDEVDYDVDVDADVSDQDDDNDDDDDGYVSLDISRDSDDTKKKSVYHKTTAVCTLFWKDHSHLLITLFTKFDAI
jgi:hypothetical protein